MMFTEDKPLEFSSSEYGSAKELCRSRQVLLEWKHVSVTVQSRSRWLSATSKQAIERKILTKVSGVAVPGSLLAIMGSSGCGKTTLLNALTKRSESSLKVEGNILVNDRLISPGKMDSISAYVQQDYLMPSFLTVKEQLTFQALLRMDSSFSQSQKLKRVEEIIIELGLIKCQDVLIGNPERTQGISGGERRRLAFAAEMLTDPPLILCDEPTSGLDASMAQNIMVMLHKMAANGKTVICTVHQPSSYIFTLFDRILLMEGGVQAFFGTTEHADEFFYRLRYTCPWNYNPADYYINLLSGITSNHEEEHSNAAGRICQAFALAKESTIAFYKKAVRSGLEKELLIKDRQCNVCKHLEIQVSKFKASITTQLRLVLWRSWLSVVRNTMQLYARTFESLSIALLFSIIYRDQHEDEVGIFNVRGLFGMILCLISFQCIFSVILTDSNDTLIFLREHRNGMYRTVVYVACKFIAEIPSTIIFPLLMTFLPFFVTGVSNSQELLIFCAVILLLAANCVSFGFFTTSITKSIGEALVFVPLLSFPLLMTSGIFINMRSVPGYIIWLKYISFFNYAGEALSINQWKDVKHIECNLSNNTCPKDGLAVLDSMNFKPNNLTVDITALITQAVALLILAWMALSYRAWRKT